MRITLGVTDNAGADFLRTRDEIIRLPVAAEERPEREALEWHMDEVFLSA